jgi:hypothetical protein
MSQDPDSWRSQQDPWPPDAGPGWNGQYPSDGYPNGAYPNAQPPQGPDPYPSNPYDPYQAGPYQPSADQAWGISSGPADRPSRTGIAAICLVGAALVVSFILSWFSGQAFVDLYRITGVALSSGQDFPDTAATDSAFTRLGLTAMAQVLPTALGVAGIIVGILALKYRTARTTGIAAIVLGVLAPFLSFGMMLLAAAPAI